MTDAAPASSPSPGSSSSNASSSGAVSGTNIDPAAAFAALGNPLRWSIYQMLAKGEALTASWVAERLKRDFDGVSKHLRVMRAAGVLSSRRSEDDGRLELYFIPPTMLRADGVVDLGFCVIRLPATPEE